MIALSPRAKSIEPWMTVIVAGGEASHPLFPGFAASDRFVGISTNPRYTAGGAAIWKRLPPGDLVAAADGVALARRYGPAMRVALANARKELEGGFLPFLRHLTPLVDFAEDLVSSAETIQLSCDVRDTIINVDLAVEVRRGSAVDMRKASGLRELLQFVPDPPDGVMAVRFDLGVLSEIAGLFIGDEASAGQKERLEQLVGGLGDELVVSFDTHDGWKAIFALRAADTDAPAGCPATPAAGPSSIAKDGPVDRIVR